MKYSLCLIWLLIIICVLGVGLEAATMPEIHGYSRQEYRVRWSETQEDQDFYQYLSLNLGKEGKDKVTGSFFSRLSADIDGRQSGNSFYPFADITDTYQDNINGRIYQAYLDFNDVKYLSKLRLGRQYVYEGETVQFDGARLELKPYWENIDFSFYGGVPTHLYESSLSGDWILGTGIEGRPLDGTRLRLDYVYVEDDNATWGDHNDDLWVLSGWQRVMDNLNLNGKYSFLDKKERDASLRANLNYPDKDLSFQASYFRQLETLRDFSVEFSPFYPVAGEYFPFHQYDFSCRKGFGEKLGIEAGVSTRDLVEDTTETNFNHEYDRYFITISIYEFLLEDTEFSLTAEQWSSNDDIRTLGFEAEKKFNKSVEVKAGSYYSLYKYDYYTSQERDDVRTAFFELELKPWKKKDVEWEIRYEAEDDDFDVYHTLKTGIKCNF
ncbi:MAG: hypothetical protein HYY56_04200 [Candidatus Omnitrophica bacterium]|nr:hypothetical protein [Candidatus Omnitrophota bacterium]